MATVLPSTRKGALRFLADGNAAITYACFRHTWGPRTDITLRCDLVSLVKLDSLAQQKTPVLGTAKCKASNQKLRGPSWRVYKFVD